MLYPAALALLDAVALIWLRNRRPAGHYLSILLFVYFAYRMAWLAWTGGGPGIESTLERGMAVLLQGGFAIGIFSLAAWMFLRGPERR